MSSELRAREVTALGIAITTNSRIGLINRLPSQAEGHYFFVPVCPGISVWNLGYPLTETWESPKLSPNRTSIDQTMQRLMPAGFESYAKRTSHNL